MIAALGVVPAVLSAVAFVLIVHHEVGVWRSIRRRTSDDSRTVTKATKKGGPPSEGPPIQYGGERLP